ncbi:MAG TPA: GNAT family N-acetyltransferase [Dehalococcoidales bacterium]|nr:GNAT family N-acetyltransferase [Dehalococcoidales bacterium]
MNIQFFPSANEFLSKVGSRLARNEARWGLILGLAKSLVADPHRFGPADPWFCAAYDGDTLRAVAMRTPPYKVLLAHISGDTASIADELVVAISKKERAIPGLTADKDLGEKFSAAWSREKNVGIKTDLIVSQRIYKLTKVNNVPLSPGHLHLASEADRLLVKNWMHGFHVDTGGEARKTREDDGSYQLSRGWVYFWIDERPVSMAIKNRPTEHGMAVGYVYTPPELRGRGYATSCVAELSREILRSGYKFCTLYTNLADVTANSIYKKIGYKLVGDSVEFTFTD